MTSLLDAKAYQAADLAALYARRWEVETNLRHLKQTLGMDVLRCVGQGDSLRPIRVVPERPGRHDPRVKKRRPKNYQLMTKPRSDLLQVLATQALSP
ncbi:MAG: transposase [Pirellulales bacterium]